MLLMNEEDYKIEAYMRLLPNGFNFSDGVVSDYTDELRDKLQKHNLTLLSLKKSGMIEKRVNDATKDILSELESITSK